MTRLSEIMRHLFYDHAVSHDDLVKLRQRAIDTQARSSGKVSAASVAAAMHALLEEGRSVKYVRMLSHKALIGKAAVHSD